MNHKSKIGLILGVAALSRAAYWIFRGGIQYGGDSASYLNRALTFSQGNIPAGGGTHLPLFSFLIAPGYWLPFSFSAYFFCYEMLLSLLTVWVLYLFAKKWASSQYALIVAGVAAVYPSILFWFPFVLSDTTFIFFLSLFLLSLIQRRAWFIVLCSGVLLACRPHAIALVGSAGFYFLFRWILNQRGPRALVVTIVLLISSVGLTFQLTNLSQKLLKSVLFVQPLWFSTQRATNIDQMNKVHLEEARISKLSAQSNGKFSDFDFKAAIATNYISNYPIKYLLMAIERFFCFWFPWAFATHWSFLHRLSEVFQSFLLITGYFLAYRHSDFHKRKNLNLLGCLLLGLSLLVMFTVADTDVRYRLPAEVILLLAAPWGWSRLLARIYQGTIGKWGQGRQELSNSSA